MSVVRDGESIPLPRLKEGIARSKYTSMMVARAMGVDQSLITRWSSLERNVPHLYATRIADLLMVELSWLSGSVERRGTPLIAEIESVVEQPTAIFKHKNIMFSQDGMPMLPPSGRIRCSCGKYVR